MAEQLTPEAKKEILDRVERKASAYNYEFAGCGQMVLLALQQEFKLPGGMNAFKASSFTGKATSGLGGVCGALVGGIMAIGLAGGRDKVEDTIWPNLDDKGPSGFAKSTEMVRDFYKRFQEGLGSLNCSELQKKFIGRSFNPESKEDNEAYSNEGGREGCSKICGLAARVAAETILDFPRR